MTESLTYTDNGPLLRWVGSCQAAVTDLTVRGQQNIKDKTSQKVDYRGLNIRLFSIQDFHLCHLERERTRLKRLSLRQSNVKAGPRPIVILQKPAERELKGVWSLDLSQDPAIFKTAWLLFSQGDGRRWTLSARNLLKTGFFLLLVDHYPSHSKRYVADAVEQTYKLFCLIGAFMYCNLPGAIFSLFELWMFYMTRPSFCKNE